MSVREVTWRAGRIAKGRIEGLSARHVDAQLFVTETDWHEALDRFRCAEGRPVLLDRARARRVADAQPQAWVDLLAAADEAIDLRFTYFGYPATNLGEPVDWNYDPVGEVRWPAIRAADIDYRSSTSDVKWIWELNRLQHLPWLGQAWLVTGDDRYAEAAFHHLDTWLEQNPPGIGIAWANAFEVGIRAISIVLALQAFRDSEALTVDRFRRLVEVLAEGATRCWIDRSRFSSANNHLVGELAGLAVVAIVFPDLPSASEWESRALTALAEESSRQILADGAGAEQAVAYQVFTAELLLVVAALLHERDGGGSGPILGAIDRSATFLAALVGRADPDPRYGDNDDGFALRLGPESVRTIRDHLGAVAVLTGSREAREVGAQSWTAEWLRQLHRDGEPAERRASTSLVSDGESHYAPHGGVVVLRRDTRRVAMDVGPLGHLSIAAHGHADALAVTLSIDGHDVIGDPGTGSYYGHPDWRTVNRGTRVHSTVEVDGYDQSVIGGAFMWARHAHVRVRGVNLDAGVVDAEHFGYRRLKSSVTHRRWVSAANDDCTVLVIDLLTGAGRHRVRTSWPLHPSLDVSQEGSGHLVTRDGSPIVHIATAGTSPVSVEQVRGDAQNCLGWWSDRLESRQPAWLIGSAVSSDLPVAVATVIQPADNGRGVVDLQVRRGDHMIDVRWHDSRRWNHATIDTTRPASVSLRSDAQD